MSFNSTRASPFRRPESPSSPATVRATTPTFQSNRPSTPSKLANSSTPSIEHTFTLRSRETPSSPTRRGSTFTEEHSQMESAIEATLSPKPAPLSRPTPSPQKLPPTNMDALSRLPPAQVREMRESFQILDQDSDGMVNREDVVEMLKSLGLDSNLTSVSPYFPASMPHPLPLPVYLSQLSSLLAPLSPPSELLAALSAFDDDDSGQIDVNELIDAVANSRPEDGGRNLSRRDIESVMEGFVGRRAFGSFSTSNKGKGDVFRYRDWVANLGAAGASQQKAAAA